jgi:hypothetical protein
MCRSDLTLWRAEAVETGGIIRPLRISEIGRAGRERVGVHRLPIGVGQIRACFHHDDQIAAAGDVESKLIRLHAKAAIISLCLWIP